MNKTEQVFLQILKAALQGQLLTEHDEITEAQWQDKRNRIQAYRATFELINNRAK